jgi:hypothetical protein
MEIKKLKKHLAKEFEVKGLWIGMILSRDWGILRSKRYLPLRKEVYYELLLETEISGCRTASAPTESSQHKDDLPWIWNNTRGYKDF